MLGVLKAHSETALLISNIFIYNYILDYKADVFELLLLLLKVSALG